jgi:hypothetical protein
MMAGREKLRQDNIVHRWAKETGVTRRIERPYKRTTCKNRIPIGTE